MKLALLAYLAVLFVLLTPGVLLRLPVGSKLAVAAAHGLVFALVWHFTQRYVLRATEGFQDAKKEMPDAAAEQIKAVEEKIQAAKESECVKKDDCKGGKSCLNGVCVEF
jgi:hypothetical protein